MRISTRSAWCSKATVRSARARTKDLAGRAGRDARALFPGGSAGSGSTGCARSFARAAEGLSSITCAEKLLAYALGRSRSLGRAAPRRDAQAKLSDERLQFRLLVETIVTSPQFLTTDAANP